MPRLHLVLCGAVLSVSGCLCSTVSGADIKSSGLHADLEVNTSSNGHSTVKATYTVGASLTFIELGSGDTLTATLGTATQPMTKSSLFGATWYQTEFSTDSEDTQVTVALARTNDTSAPSSTVTLPAPLSITAPTGSPHVSRAGTTPLDVSWSTTRGDAIRASASGSCVQTVSETVLLSDTGTWRVPRLVAESGKESQSCQVTVTIKRVRQGTVDPGYGKGGSFEARVVRDVVFTSDP